MRASNLLDTLQITIKLAGPDPEPELGLRPELGPPTRSPGPELGSQPELGSRFERDPERDPGSGPGSSKKRKEDPGCNLTNLGQTCYVNGVIQMLYHGAKQEVMGATVKAGTIAASVQTLFKAMGSGVPVDIECAYNRLPRRVPQ